MKLKFFKASHPYISMPGSLIVTVGCSNEAGDSIEVRVTIEADEPKLKSMSLLEIEKAATERALALIAGITD